MKKVIVLIIASALGLLPSCQKMPEAQHADSVVIYSVIPKLEPTEGTLRITVYATTDWSITGEGWLSVSPSTGTVGISETVLQFPANDTGLDRTACLTLTAGTYTHTQSVTQSKNQSN